jgi:hypothetical protein
MHCNIFYPEQHGYFVDFAILVTGAAMISARE